MVHDMRSMGLSYLMEFRKHWNNEIICQFYASYHHEKDPSSAIDIIYWTTEGVGAENDQLVNICSFVVHCDQRWPSTQ